MPNMATLFAVTVRLKKNPAHDPRNKKSGSCPVSGQPCTDITGEHHTFLLASDRPIPAEAVVEIYGGIYHVTRVEEVILDD